jgi:hypothetical protein
MVDEGFSALTQPESGTVHTDSVSNVQRFGH